MSEHNSRISHGTTAITSATTMPTNQPLQQLHRPPPKENIPWVIDILDGPWYFPADKSSWNTTRPAQTNIHPLLFLRQTLQLWFLRHKMNTTSLLSTLKKTCNNSYRTTDWLTHWLTISTPTQPEQGKHHYSNTNSWPIFILANTSNQLYNLSANRTANLTNLPSLMFMAILQIGMSNPEDVTGYWPITCAL